MSAFCTHRQGTRKTIAEFQRQQNKLPLLDPFKQQLFEGMYDSMFAYVSK
jgi:hypothetical protein